MLPAQAAVDRPCALRRLLALPDVSRANCLVATSRAGRTPLVTALLREPFKSLHSQACTWHMHVAHAHGTCTWHMHMHMPSNPLHSQACVAMAAAGAALSDGDFACLRAMRRLPRLIAVVSSSAPARPPPIPSHPPPCTRWQPQWHWSFPESDRQAIALTVALARRGHARLPPELWRDIFERLERGWCAPPALSIAREPRLVGGAAAAVADAGRAQLEWRLAAAADGHP